ncbi:putative histone promoter control 2 protein [Golovinomyces cichoracearum]|uniref:Putative histone promoter control 2 protein n=1 Tax=Golovinomyces cichoracearum TaxID=62708 RepID=A0A420J7G3_9PEZI|nr:putative histone promoter control 2 protein [Golovinomyces cichoracearum]
MELPVLSTPRKLDEPAVPCSPAQLSSEGLSSPPRSSPEAASPSAHASNEVLPITTSTTSPSSVTPSATSILASSVPSEKPPPQRKPRRKPKDSATSSLSRTSQSNSQITLNTASTVAVEAPPKPKRIRKPKDPNAPPAQRRKKNSAPNKSGENVVDSKLNAARTLPSQLSEPMLAANAAQVLYSQAKKIEESHGAIQSFFINVPPPTSSPPIQLQAQARTPGQKYDPIRSSSNYDPVRETVVSHETLNTTVSSQNKLNTSSQGTSSKSISNVIDFQNQKPSSTPTNVPSFFSQKQTRIPLCNAPSVPITPESNETGALSDLINPDPPKPIVSAPIPKKSDPIVPLNLSKKSNVNVIGSSLSPKSIKLRDPKEISNNISPTPPPLPGSGNESNDVTEYRAPTVILSIPINGEVNKYVNFTRLAEQQYGWDALHPRLAAQRDRLARVAAAGAALERSGSNKDSGDEMSLDSEAEGSNAEMGGMSDGRPGADCVKKVPKKRKMREDEYDKDDGFVDDTELLWEEQAAASNDGFFVYSGPLIPEGEKAGIDAKSDSVTKRGRGRGTRGGVARSSGTRASAANTTTAARNNLPATGPGSRGGTGVRKPRVTKAERARIEQEKLAREKSVHPSTQSSSSNITVLANPPTDGDVPMLLSQ